MFTVLQDYDLTDNDHPEGWFNAAHHRFFPGSGPVSGHRADSTMRNQILGEDPRPAS